MSTYTSKLISELHSFQHSAAQSCHQRAARGDFILGLIFEIGTAGGSFTQTERKQIGESLSDELAAIKSSVNYTVCKFKKGLEPWWLTQRSALQFLIDDYAAFPVEGNTTLAQKIKEAELDASVAKLDQVLQKWNDIRDSDESHTSEEFKHLGVPRAHVWWF